MEIRDDRLQRAADQVPRLDAKFYERPALVVLGSVTDLTLHHRDWHHHGHHPHHDGGFHHGSV